MYSKKLLVLIWKFTDSDNSEEFGLCDSYEQVIFPNFGKLRDGAGDLSIFNTNEYKQSVRVSLCRNAGQPCKLSEYFPAVYQTECKQRMVYRELVSLSPTGLPIKEHFEFPAHCSCVVKRVTSLWKRFMNINCWKYYSNRLITNKMRMKNCAFILYIFVNLWISEKICRKNEPLLLCLQWGISLSFLYGVLISLLLCGGAKREKIIIVEVDV